MSDERPDLAEEAGAAIPGGPPETEPPEPTLFRRITGVGMDWRNLIVLPLLAVVLALLVGAVVIALGDIDTLKLWGSEPGEAASTTFGTIRDAYVALVRGSLGGLGPISETLVRAAPLILAGLAVAIGFQAGLFNIGARGQMFMGGMAALAVGINFDGLPAVVHIPLAVLAGFAGGALWGAFPGWLKGVTGAHEVITTIMMNFIAAFLTDYLLLSSFYQREGRTDPISEIIFDSARYPRLLDWLRSGLRVHLGIIIAILAATAVWWILYRSTIGFEFRAVGLNPHGARYAGMGVILLYTSVMALAGGLAGLGGADQLLGTLGVGFPNFAGTVGFDAIALALLGRSHPFGVVAAGLLFGALAAGGNQMQAASGVGIDLVQVIQALIIVFIAAPALIRAVFRFRTGEGAGQLTRGWSSA